MVELMELPVDSLQQILSKLPIKTILACQCVCKTFLNLTNFKTPYFTALHSQNAVASTQINLVFQFSKHVHPDNYVYLIDAHLDSTKVVSPSFTIPKLPADEQLNNNNNNKPAALVNGCNGLIYFAVKSSGNQRSSLICNPITNEAFTVPNVDWRTTSTSSLWLGFSPVSRMYKVLRFFNHLSAPGKVLDYGGAHIHDVGSSSFRRVKSPEPLDNVINWDNSYAFINGIGYWLCQDQDYDDDDDYQSDFIVSFDFESEILGTINTPPSFDERRLRCRDLMAIGVVGDCLCLIDNTGNHHLDIWMMNKGGGGGDWIKKFTCQEKPPYLCRATLRPLQVMSSGDILIVSDNHNLVFYDVKRNNFRLINYHAESNYFRVVTFVPSFVSIFDSLSLSLPLSLKPLFLKGN